MTNADREPFYGGLLGQISFNVVRAAKGHTQDEIDELWRARFPQPAPPSNVVYGVDFTKSK